MRPCRDCLPNGEPFRHRPFATIIPRPVNPTLTPKEAAKEAAIPQLVAPIPLLGAKADILITDYCAEITLAQRYENREE